MDCREAIKEHQREHAESRGSWIMACAEGWCGYAKDCGREGCPVCPTEAGPA